MVRGAGPGVHLVIPEDGGIQFSTTTGEGARLRARTPRSVQGQHGRISMASRRFISGELRKRTILSIQLITGMQVEPRWSLAEQ